MTTTTPSSDAERYAAREAKSAAVAEFQGGEKVVLAIGGSTLAIVLVVIILVILL